MEVNVTKTKVIVCRKGESCPNRRDSFTEGKGQDSRYRYLGLIFSSKNLNGKKLLVEKNW